MNQVYDKEIVECLLHIQTKVCFIPKQPAIYFT